MICAKMLVSVAIGASTTCSHAQSATFTISHNDPDGIVVPGQTVQLSATISWANAVLFWRSDGELIATPNIGFASNPRFGHPMSPGVPPTIIQPGTPAGGSVVDVLIQSGVAPLMPWAPLTVWAVSSGVTLLVMDWTAPQDLGLVSFGWTPSAIQPHTLLFETWGSVDPVAVPTTYIGTSLTVVPAPASCFVLILGEVVTPWTKRRRATR